VRERDNERERKKEREREREKALKVTGSEAAGYCCHFMSVCVRETKKAREG